MPAGAEHIDHIFTDIDRLMSVSLNSVCMEKNAVLPRNFTNLPDRLNGADFIVGRHDSN